MQESSTHAVRCQRNARSLQFRSLSKELVFIRGSANICYNRVIAKRPVSFRKPKICTTWLSSGPALSNQRHS